MNLFKDLKVQVALVGLIVAAIHYFVPDIDEKSLTDVVIALVSLIFGGHGMAQYIKGKKAN